MFPEDYLDEDDIEANLNYIPGWFVYIVIALIIILGFIPWVIGIIKIVRLFY